VLPLKAISHDAFTPTQMRKACTRLKLFDPLTNKDAISSVYLFPLVECYAVEKVTR